MSYDSGRKGRSTFHKVRGYTGMVMGVIYLLLASITIYTADRDPLQLHLGTAIFYIVGALMAAYGIFRIYRGYKISQDNNY